MIAKINTLAIIGVGLIGGSLSLALKAKGAVGRVIGVGRSAANLREALQLGIIDAVATLDEAARADIIFVATPVAQMPQPQPTMVVPPTIWPRTVTTLLFWRFSTDTENPLASPFL